MNLEAESPVAQVVEPLLFRSLEEITAEVRPDTEAAVDTAPAEIVDVKAELRAAHEQGRREAMETADRDLQERLKQERDAVARAVRQFEQEKQRYFSEVEGEVVKLSLAIAERVLHREAEMDPMLLAGAARVALDQVADSSEAVLRVATDDVGRWNDTLASGARGMVIEGDAAMTSGEMVLKTKSGTVELGVRAQLQEIERGFFELLGRRPPMVA